MAATHFNHDHMVTPGAEYEVSSLKGKSVVITGAASGIGEACMRSFVAAGAFVTFGDVSSDRAQKLVSEIGDDKVAFVHCDTRTWQDQATLFKVASERCNGNIDIVFANAGISGSDPIFSNDSDSETGDPVEPDLKIIQTNLIGVLYTTKLALHYFRRQAEGDKRDGCLIITGSLAGYLDHNGAVQYSAAKAGIRGVMRSLRQKLPEQSARVNIIAPWFIQTGIISGKASDVLQANNVPFATVEDAAAAVMHLASDKKLNGRALTIVPREVSPEGYFDLEKDDEGDEDIIEKLRQRFANVRTVPDAGRGVFARETIAAGTALHRGERPFAHLLFRKYRKEVCAQCFFYDRGRSLPIRDNDIGKVFCGEGCRTVWNEEHGELGYSIWKSLHALTQKFPKAVTDVSSNEPQGKVPDVHDVETAWSKAEQYVRSAHEPMPDKTNPANVKSTAQKRVKPKSYDLIDPDLIAFFLSAILCNHKDPSSWRAAMDQLAMNNLSYKSQYDLDGHCASFVQLTSILPAELKTSEVVQICRLAIEAGSHNAFGIRAGGEDSEEYMGYGIYPTSSYFNHSCLPNLAKRRVGRAWLFNAQRNLAVGEQICITYLGGDEKDLNVVERRAVLKECWGFTCMCARCCDESQ